ncbi:MAG TPA: hypothetical protein VLJ37_03260 [bacterium]|nr:hypothetical protein [bacterium]
MTVFRVVGLAGGFAMAGCRLFSPPQVPEAPRARRAPYPEFPALDDPLATSPCSVKGGPDITLRDVTDHGLLVPLHENLAFLEKANPVFLCGLERIDLLGDDAYSKSASPEYTRRSVGLYTPDDRVIRLKASAGITLTHEVGHHIHNLGYFAPTVRDFLAQSWEIDPKSHERKPLCAGPDCFLNDAAASKPTEDWARTFENVLLRPIETGVATNFSLNGPTPMQEKVRLIRSIAALPEPVKAVIRFGKVRTLDAAEALSLKENSKSQAMPAALPGDEIRRIFVEGRSSLRGTIWDQRGRSFLSGDYVLFPAFQDDRKTLGFFAYDLMLERFSPVTLDLEDVPEEFRKGNFSGLGIAVLDDGTLLLIGYSDEASIAAPAVFVVSPRSAGGVSI